MRWRKAAILGVGLLGGSLGIALRRGGFAGEVAGLVRREATGVEALAAGAVDVASTRLEEVLDGADLVVLATPLSPMAELAAGFVGHLANGALVTDVGSVKVPVIEAVEERVRGAGGRFVGSHPMAGSEQSGVGAARADLFAEAVVVITPTPVSDAQAVAEVAALWTSLGARVFTMPAILHDELVSRSSHLPHIVAAGLVHYILGGKHPPEQRQLCAAGFRDTTRVASGSPEMWRDIVIGNREAVLAALREFSLYLESFQTALKMGDEEAVLDYFIAAKRRRDGWRTGAGTGGE